MAAVSAFLVVLLGAMLFDDRYAAVLSGLVLSLLPMQLWWTNTAAAEPSAAMWCAAAMVAAVHFTRSRTTSALACAVAVTAFATTLRPESVLVVPLAVAVVGLFAPDEFKRLRLWWAAPAGAGLCLMTLLHLVAVRNENWGTTAARLGWQYVPANFVANFWFYWGHDDRFPVLFSVAAVAGLVSYRRMKARFFLAFYFLLFWGLFIAFYAGSYYYGADVRYSLLSYVPLALLAGAGLARLVHLLSRWWPARTVLAGVAAGLLLQFSWYAPVTRAVGEEAWAARADVKYARRFAQHLPANAIVLTHNPSLFHVWGINAAQLSLAETDPAYVRGAAVRSLRRRRVPALELLVQRARSGPDRILPDGLDAFPTELVDSARERDYEYAMYRLIRGPEPDGTPQP